MSKRRTKTTYNNRVIDFFSFFLSIFQSINIISIFLFFPSPFWTLKRNTCVSIHFFQSSLHMFKRRTPKTKKKGGKKHYQKHEDQIIVFVVTSHENCSVCFCARWSVLGAVTMRAYARVVLCFLGLKLKAKVSETDWFGLHGVVEEVLFQACVVVLCLSVRPVRLLLLFVCRAALLCCGCKLTVFLSSSTPPPPPSSSSACLL